MGEDTWRLTRSTIRYEALGDIAAKGKQLRVATFRAIDGVDRGDDSATPFVGRDDELVRLRAVFDSAVAAREARLATVIGAPGVGKTRLAAEFERALGDEARVVDLRLELAGGTTFAPIADLMRMVAGVAHVVDADSDDAAGGEQVVEQLRSVVASLDDAERVASLLASFLGIGPTRSTEELFYAVRRLLVAMGGDRPIVLVVDDVQWAEPLFLDLLENLTEWIRGSPAVILGLARTASRSTASSWRRPTWSSGSCGSPPTSRASLRPPRTTSTPPSPASTSSPPDPTDGPSTGSVGGSRGLELR